MFGHLFKVTLYVRVYLDQFVLRRIEDKKVVTVSAVEPFTTQRLLVGNFSVAEKYLREGVDKVVEGRWFSPAPIMVIHPLEMTEGGLSQVEERLFEELAAGSGARKVVVWEGQELSDHEVVRRIE